jgi:tetratricopeptide (TPR) repeat protein
VPQALDFARKSVELANLCGDLAWQIAFETTLGDALHQAGRPNEADEAFRKAEAKQKKHLREFPILYSWWGFKYCGLLLAQRRHREVQNRAAQTIEIAKRNNWLLDIALDNLSLGRAWLLQARREGGRATSQAAEFLQRAVDGLRQSGRMDHLPRGLLARAELRRVRGEYERARTDLDEAQRLAERSEMGLHLADCHLGWARLRIATGERAQAREHWATAKAMVERMGYHRRDGEVAEIARDLGEVV